MKLSLGIEDLQRRWVPR